MNSDERATEMLRKQVSAMTADDELIEGLYEVATSGRATHRVKTCTLAAARVAELTAERHTADVRREEMRAERAAMRRERDDARAVIAAVQAMAHELHLPGAERRLRRILDGADA
ncbi:MAG: hypothetical protein AAGA17_00315 [Actinomycetota bacterium]